LLRLFLTLLLAFALFGDFFLHMFVDHILHEVGLANDGEGPVVVLADRYDDVLRLPAEEVHILRPPPNLVELDVVLHSLGHTAGEEAELRLHTRHVLRDHLHEEGIEDVHRLRHFLFQRVVLEELEKEQHEGVIQVDARLESVEVLHEDGDLHAARRLSLILAIERQDRVVLPHLRDLVAPGRLDYDSFNSIGLLVGLVRNERRLFEFWLLRCVTATALQHHHILILSLLWL
jgi:hypothetical protein